MAVPNMLSELDNCSRDEVVRLVGQLFHSIPAAQQHIIAYLEDHASGKDLAADREALASFRKRLSKAADDARLKASADIAEDYNDQYSYGRIWPLDESARMMDAIREVKGSVKGSVPVRVKMMILLMKQMVQFEMEEGAEEFCDCFTGNELALELDEEMFSILEELEDLPPSPPVKASDGSWSDHTVALLKNVAAVYSDKYLQCHKGWPFVDNGLKAGRKALVMIRKGERAEAAAEKDAKKRPKKKAKNVAKQLKKEVKKEVKEEVKEEVTEELQQVVKKEEVGRAEATSGPTAVRRRSQRSRRCKKAWDT